MFAVVVAAGTLFAEDKKAPEKITYAAKPGEVTFDHAKHVEAAKKDCKVCHESDKGGKIAYKDVSPQLNNPAQVPDLERLLEALRALR